MIEINKLTASFDDTPVLRGIDLEIDEGEIFCLLGSSGCGKTTLLRIIAGLEESDNGQVLINGESISHIPVHLRDFGLMFQDFALFPHMDVIDNVRFGLKMRGMDSEDQQKRAHEVLELVGLSDFEERDVTQLSGGEKQRVALARSLAPNPRLLMLDEPLGSLDAGLRERLAIDLRNIIKRVGLTSIYVTHDQQEAFAIADRIAIMNDGRIEQVGTPQELYKRPQTAFAAQFLGLANTVPVISYENGSAKTVIGDFPVTDMPDSLLIHPDGIRLADSNSAGKLTGNVVECVFQGNSYRVRVELGPGTIFVFDASSYNGNKLQVGDNISLSFTDDAIISLKR